jgi:endonuclease/exonuclease/phosphatase family metal-dependent hydrolase
MRLLTYNIHKSVGGLDRRYRPERVLDVIAAEQPDLICLQEVEAYTAGKKSTDHPPRVAERLGAVDWMYQADVSCRRGGYGNLVLSRWPFREREQVSLSVARRLPRGAQLVVVDTPSGPLRLVNWHLGLREQERRWQAGRLLEHDALRNGELPIVVAGDCNDWRNTLERHVFAARQFVQATAPARRFRSFPAFLALTALDKVFYRGPLAMSMVRVVRHPLARRASDHLPLVVDFDLTPTGAAPRSAG